LYDLISMSGIFVDGSWFFSFGVNCDRSAACGTDAAAVVGAAAAVLVEVGAPGVVVPQPASSTAAAASRILGIRTLVTPLRHVDSTSRFVQVEAGYLDFAK
jgi:hypothetical protein